MSTCNVQFQDKLPILFFYQCSQPESSWSLSFASQRSVPVQSILDWAPHPRKNSNCICVHSHAKTWLNSWKSAPYDNHMTRPKSLTLLQQFTLSHAGHHWDKNRLSSSLHMGTKLHYWGWPTIYVCVEQCVASSWGQWTHSRPHCARDPWGWGGPREGVCV